MANLFKRENLPIWFILIGGLAVRVIGIQFGLPDLYHADEPIVVNHAVAYGTGDLNPHFFKIPPLVSYLLSICYGVYFILGRLLGWFVNVRDFQNLFLSDPSCFYLIGRIIFGALCGTATVYLFYRLLDRFFSRNHAILGSFFFAFAFLHVRDSHYIYADIPLLLVLVMAFFPIFDCLERRNRNDYILFGLALGTAVATKYNGIFILIPFLFAHLINRRFLDFNLLLSLIIALISYAILNPFSIVDAQFFLSEIKTQGGTFGQNVIHLTRSLPEGLGLPLIVAAALGAWIEPSRKKALFLIFIVAYGYILVFFSQPFERYTLAIVPFVIFFAADFLISSVEKFKSLGKVYRLLALLIILPSLFKIYLSDTIFVKEDIRSISKKWIEHSIPENSKVAIAYPFLTPRLKLNLAQLQEKTLDAGEGLQKKRLELLIEQAKSGSERRFELYFLKESDDKTANPFLFARPTVLYNMEHLKTLGIQYVLIPKIDPFRKDEFPSQFYRELTQKSKLTARFSPFWDKNLEWPIDENALTGGPFLWKDLLAREQNGEIIEIYQL